MKPTLLALIPAKQHSDRLPAKNLRLLSGKPLIVHTIACALQCKSIDRIIVSTDSPLLKEISLRAGAEVPFLRPPELAADSATTEGVIFHAVQFLKEQEQQIYDYFLVLQPTSPLRTPDDVEQAFRKLLEANADSIVSISNVSIPVSHLVIEESGYLKPVNQIFPKDQPPFYKLNGAVYISRTEVLLENGRLLGEKVLPFFMPESRSIDIDTADDFFLAANLIAKGARKLR